MDGSKATWKLMKQLVDEATVWRKVQQQCCTPYISTQKCRVRPEQVHTIHSNDLGWLKEQT